MGIFICADRMTERWILGREDWKVLLKAGDKA